MRRRIRIMDEYVVAMVDLVTSDITAAIASVNGWWELTGDDAIPAPQDIWNGPQGSYPHFPVVVVDATGTVNAPDNEFGADVIVTLEVDFTVTSTKAVDRLPQWARGYVSAINSVVAESRRLGDTPFVLKSEVVSDEVTPTFELDDGTPARSGVSTVHVWVAESERNPATYRL